MRPDPEPAGLAAAARHHHRDLPVTAGQEPAELAVGHRMSLSHSPPQQVARRMESGIGSSLPPLAREILRCGEDAEPELEFAQMTDRLEGLGDQRVARCRSLGPGHAVAIANTFQLAALLAT